MTKKIVSLFLALALLAAVPAFAEPTEIDGISDRNIKINRASLNPSADDVIGEGFSPTTGRALDEIETFAKTYAAEFLPTVAYQKEKFRGRRYAELVCERFRDYIPDGLQLAERLRGTTCA